MNFLLMPDDKINLKLQGNSTKYLVHISGAGGKKLKNYIFDR